MVIIGFGTTAQSGKDTSCDYLLNKFPEGTAAKVPFADGVKQTAMNVFGLSYSQCYGSKEDKETSDSRFPKLNQSGEFTPRELMQGIGDQLRAVYPAVWIDKVFNVEIPKLKSQGYSVFLISDVRYPNEALKIKEHGGYLVKVNREGSGVLTGKGHASETSMNDFKDYDFIINNNGSFQDLYYSLDVIYDELF